jgi:hypothetical protein
VSDELVIYLANAFVFSLLSVLVVLAALAALMFLYQDHQS